MSSLPRSKICEVSNLLHTYAEYHIYLPNEESKCVSFFDGYIDFIGERTRRFVSHLLSSTLAVETNKLMKSCRACITSPRCSSGGCSVRFRVVFNNSISIITLMNLRF